MSVAKLSLSQRLFHHFIVTKLPNHWWLNSCEITVAMYCLLATVVVVGSASRAISRYVISPQFSIAPDEKSGSATWSLFGNG